MCSVGVTSACFHACSGKAKSIMRTADYTSISIASILAVRCASPNLPWAVSAGSLAAVPLSPPAVTSANWIWMQKNFLEYSNREGSRIRNYAQAHIGAATLSFCLFALEEFAPQVPVCHAGWHLASATCIHALERGLLTSKPSSLSSGPH
jgi:hypothetical protein